MIRKILYRIFPHPQLTMFLLVIWLLLVNNVTVGNVILGLVFGVLIPGITQPFWPNRPVITRPLKAASYILIVLWDITHPGARDAVPPIDGGRNVDHVCLACGPFAHDALRDHLQRHGVAITREARHGGARGMGASFYVSDPDGNRIEIKGPPEHPDLPAAHG